MTNKLNGHDISEKDYSQLQDKAEKCYQEVHPRKPLGACPPEGYLITAISALMFSPLFFYVGGAMLTADVIYAATYPLRSSPESDPKKVEERKKELTDFLCEDLGFSKDKADMFIDNIKPTIEETLQEFESIKASSKTHDASKNNVSLEGVSLPGVNMSNTNPDEVKPTMAANQSSKSNVLTKT